MGTHDKRISAFSYCEVDSDKYMDSQHLSFKEQKKLIGELIDKNNNLSIINLSLKKKILNQNTRIRHYEEINKEQLEFSRQSFVSFCCLNNKGLIKEWNNSLQTISGIDLKQSLDENVKTIFKKLIPREEDYEMLIRSVEHLIQSKSDSHNNISFETELQNVKTKKATHVRFFLQPIVSKYNSFITMVLYDITKEKKQEAEIAKYNECINNILTSNTESLIKQTRNIIDLGNNSPDLILRIELINELGAFKILNLNAAAKKFYNVAVERGGVHNDIYEFLPGKYNVQDLDSFNTVKNGISFITKEEKVNKYWNTYVYSIESKSNINQLIFISRDVTDQYEKERLSFMLKSSVDSLTSPYWVCNAKSEFVIQNKICKKYWGDQLGKVFDFELISEIARQKVREGVTQVLKGDPFSIQYKINYTDSYRFVLLKLSPLKSDSGEIKGFIGIIFDITERKDLERQLLKSVIETEERERKFFSQELHDSVSPLLSAAGLYIDWLEKPNRKLAQQEVIGDLRKLVNDANVSCREISHKLSPHFLENAGLEEALQIYCNTVAKSNAIQFNLSFKMERRTKKIIEIVLYRVLCECITNTIKHASASTIQIVINSSKTGVTVKYSDDGKGFDMDIIHNQQKGMGILSIKNRIKYLNGTLAINSSIGKGFHLDINITY